MIQLFLQMDIKKSLLLSLQVLESFKKVSGLKLNHKKLKRLTFNLSKHWKGWIALPWKNWNGLRVLGIWLSTKLKVTMEANYSDRQLGIWMIGTSWKDYIVKSLIASNLVDFLSPFAEKLSCSSRIEQIFNFLWSGTGDKSTEIWQLATI